MKKGRCWLVHNGFSKTESTRLSLERLRQNLLSKNVDAQIKKHNLLPLYFDESGNAVCDEELPDFCIYWDKDVERAAMLEKCGVRVFNKSAVIELCDDKNKTFLYLSGKNIPMPETITSPLLYPAFDDTDGLFADSVEKRLGYPMVVKEAYGSFGAQVYLAKNRSELDALRNRLKYMPHLYQRYVKNSSGEDIRIIVVGGKAVAAMKRKNKGDFRANIELGGVGEKALLRFLSDRPNIKTVYLCLDSDQAGSDACSRLAELVPEGLTVHRLVPLYKDWNEVLQHRAEIADGKYLREAIYGLKEPPQEETVEIIRMSEVDTQTVEWLWEPYIPFGKVTIVQGNPGEGKTTFALRLAAACTTGGTLPGMKPLPPFQVIYQTAEDGLGDTVKPRLIEAAADLDRVLVIDEAKRELTLSDERIEKAITQNGARLIILDPIQAYMGEKTDMNRANEVRPMFRRLADVAERTGCAVILIGHLNKAAGGQSAYRGLGSIDFRAAARSVLLIGRVKREPNVRVIVHDKSSLAPEGKPVAFCLDPETGFSWIGEYDITADELLSGAGGNNATKTEQAERLILDLLADGKELASEDIEKAATEAGISARTVRAAKRNLDGRITSKRIGAAWYHALKK